MAHRLFDLPHYVAFCLTLPSLALHELVHAVALLPFGGPDGVYVIYDTSKEWTRHGAPVGAAVCHRQELGASTDVFVSLAPFVLAVPLVWIHHMSEPLRIAALVVALGAFPTFGDALLLIAPDRFEKWFSTENWEFRLLMEFPRFSNGAIPLPEVVADD